MTVGASRSLVRAASMSLAEVNPIRAAPIPEMAVASPATRIVVKIPAATPALIDTLSPLGVLTE